MGQIGFDVPVVVDGGAQQVTAHHTNRGFGGRVTVPDDMGHDGTVRQARDYETAALPLSYAGVWGQPGLYLRSHEIMETPDSIDINGENTIL